MSIWDDITDTTNDAFSPKSMSLWGMLAGLGKAATPIPGRSGMGAGTGLLTTLGDVASGGMEGAQKGQTMQGAGIANQMAQLGLTKQQALQPYQIAMIKKVLGANGLPGALPGSMPGATDPSGAGGGAADPTAGAGAGIGSAPSAPYMAVISKPTMADQRFANAYDLAMVFKPEEAQGVMKSWAENTPELAGAKKFAEATNSVNQTPNGPVFGINGIPGAPGAGGASGGAMPFGLVPNPAQATSDAIKTVLQQRDPGGIGPGSQRPPDDTTPENVLPQQPPPRDASFMPGPGVPPPPPPPQGMQPPLAPPQGPQGQLPPPPMPQQLPPGMSSLPSNGQPMPPIPPMNASAMPPGAVPGAPPNGQPPQGAPPGAGMPPGGAQQLAALIQKQKAAQDPAAPDPTGMPKYHFNPMSKVETEQATKFGEADAKVNDSLSDQLNTYAQSEQRLNTIAQAFKEVKSGGLATDKAKVANILQGLGVDPKSYNLDDPKSVYNVLHENGLNTINQLKTMTQGTASKFTNNEFNRIGNYLQDPDLPPEAQLQGLGEAIGTIHYDKQMINDWHQIGGLGNRAAATPEGNFTQRPADFMRDWQLSHKMGDFVEAAKKSIGPLKGMPGDPIDMARQAIQRGAPRAAVIQRLKDNKIDPGDL